jgi:PAS domain S-box-containing protein
MKKAISPFLRAHWLDLLESFDEGVMLFEPEGNIAFMNEYAAQLTGHSARLAIGKPFLEVLRRNAWLEEIVRTTFANPQRAVHLSGTLSRRDMPDLPASASCIPVRREDGAVLGTLLTIRDISYQVELESQTRQTERLAELETLVAGLAHEIRNPLAGVRGATQLLTTLEPGDPRMRECASIVAAEIERIDGLVAELLQLSARPPGESHHLNIHEVIEHVLSIMEPSAPTLRFERQFDPSLPPILAEGDRLKQVLMNLIRNAIDVSPDGASIRVSTRFETSYRIETAATRSRLLCVQIEDQGPGVPESDRERIFAPFYTTKSSGTGLGLAISRRIATEHGGSLKARCGAQGGAAFVLSLPMELGNENGH